MDNRFNIRRRSAVLTAIKLKKSLGDNILIFKNITISIKNYPSSISFIFKDDHNFSYHSYINIDELIDIYIIQNDINSEKKVEKIEQWIIDTL